MLVLLIIKLHSKGLDKNIGDMIIKKKTIIDLKIKLWLLK